MVNVVAGGAGPRAAPIMSVTAHAKVANDVGKHWMTTVDYEQIYDCD